MAQPNALTQLSASLQAQANALDREGISPGLRAVLVASRDRKVQKSLLEHLERGDLFIGATPYAASEHTEGEGFMVLFSFRPSGRHVDLLPPRVAAFLKSDGKAVIRVVDPAPATIPPGPESWTRMTQAIKPLGMDGVTIFHATERGHTCGHQPSHTTSETFSGGYGGWPSQDDGACDDEW